MPDGALAVTGTSKCSVEFLDSTRDSDGVEVIEERFLCDTTMSDS